MGREIPSFSIKKTFLIVLYLKKGKMGDGRHGNFVTFSKKNRFITILMILSLKNDDNNDNPVWTFGTKVIILKAERLPSEGIMKYIGFSGNGSQILSERPGREDYLHSCRRSEMAPAELDKPCDLDGMKNASPITFMFFTGGNL
ncbi:MAG: hypothetical protein Q4D62_01025 [Planctomycetia bacterium]|nr:hypothetical protein [Planctomycetia bacterium]